MHELSIARALVDRLPALTPRGRRITTIHISVGPLQAIEPETMRMAWRAVTYRTGFSQIELDVRSLPYRWACAQCGNDWTSEETYSACACGNEQPDWVGGDELTIDSLEVEPKEFCHGS